MRMVARAVSAVVLAWWMAAAAPAQGPAELLEKAVYTEETVGDLEAALKMYRQIVDDAEAARPQIAHAYYRLGMALVKTGQEDEGYVALEKVVRLFPEQREVVRKAQDVILARIRDAVPRNDPKAYFYVDSKEAPGGEPATLRWTFSDGTVSPVQTGPDKDTILISYLSEGAYGSFPKPSVSLNDMNRILLQFPSPAQTGALERAELELPVKLPPQLVPVEAIELGVYAIEEDWQEPSATWLSQPAFAPQPVATFAVPPRAGTVTVDITRLAREWLAGTRPNYGIALKAATPYFGPSPLDASVSGGKYTAAEMRQMDVGTLFTRMIYCEVGRQYYAGLWALLAKAEEPGSDARAAILDRALNCVADPKRWTYERWLCAYLLAGLDEERVVPVLTGILKADPLVSMREGAAGALAEIGTPAARAALQEAVNTESVERVRVVVEKALKWELPKHERGNYLAPGPEQAK